MRFHFNDRKTAQAAAQLLKLHGRPMTYMKLIKLMYLADREMLLQHGVPVTGDRLVSMKNGPVLSRVYDFINHGVDRHPSAWFDYISAPQGYEVSLKTSDPESDELSRFELRLLAKLHGQYGQMDQWKLVARLHELPEWKDPGASTIPIEYADILRAANRSESEIQELKKLAEEMWFLGKSAS